LQYLSQTSADTAERNLLIPGIFRPRSDFFFDLDNLTAATPLAGDPPP
jgi:hypothetical protein